MPLAALPLIQRNPVGQPRYYWNEDRPSLRYSSVTSILSATQSDATRYALKRWKQKIIAEGGDPEETRQEAARRGSRIHDWFEQFLLRQDPAVPDDIAPWCQRIQASPLWGMMDHVVCTEHQVCSDQHLVPFAGTLDALLKINSEFCLFDLKTKAPNKSKPSKQISNEAMCQLQAYRLGLKENYGIEVTRFMALYVFPDQPAYLVSAAGDDLQAHETHWTNRMHAYKAIQECAVAV